MNSYQKLFPALLIISLLFSSCDKDMNPDNGCNLGTYMDDFDDTDKSFIDMGSLIVDLRNDTIVVSMEMKSLPPELTFNQSALALNSLNYNWQVLFDLDGSGSQSMGDISFQVMKFKFAEGEITADILATTQENIWLSGANFTADNVSEIVDVVVSQDKFIFKVPTSLYDGLTEIDCSTKMIFYTLFNDGLSTYQDKFPN